MRNAKRSINPLCEHCLLEGKLTPVDVIDHVRELKDDWSKRLDLSNLQSLCNRCHAIKSAKERQGRLKR
ncbi:HNH endonuclease signature motif containing protein [Priestia aryabhattai]|uniref:HNH endonuclease signature motif containing protein n=1 Tax=Priestia aryabhattai TaxID=412384 RepID=UPI002E23B317|nr:HNH endonuclease signature motif containing protein [Priestia aryabhattai]